MRLEIIDGVRRGVADDSTPGVLRRLFVVLLLLAIPAVGGPLQLIGLRDQGESSRDRGGPPTSTGRATILYSPDMPTVGAAVGGHSFSKRGPAVGNVEWDDQFFLRGTSHYVNALAWDGAGLYVGGIFSVAGGVAASRVAYWDPATRTYSALGAGVDGEVLALEWDGRYLYVGGRFSYAGGKPADGLARWDPATRTFSTLGSFHGLAMALEWENGELYVGGSFLLGGATYYSLARWDHATQAWSPIGTVSGQNATVFALAYDGKGLYIGGSFDTVAGVSANCIVYWDPATGNFTPLGSGMNWQVYALAWDGSELYAGGAFTKAGGVRTELICRWDPGSRTFAPLASGMDNWVFSLAWGGSSLYAAGWFTTAGGVRAHGLARWDSVAQQWSSLGTGVSDEAGVVVIGGPDLYAGGWFTDVDGVIASNLARFSFAEGRWHSMPEWGNGLGRGSGSSSWGIAAGGGRVYAVGDFATAGGLHAGGLTAWDEGLSAWTTLGPGMGGYVNTMIWDGSGLYVGGRFSSAGGVPANNVARWDPGSATWSALGSGVGSVVSALVWDGRHLFAGGRFGKAGGILANGVAEWDPGTGSWAPLGLGIAGGPKVLAFGGGKLYAGGSFLQAGGVKASHVAQWDPQAATWNPLGLGVNDDVCAAVFSGSDLFVGGLFTQAGGLTANSVARWDPGAMSWSPLGKGVNGNVYALAWDGRRVVVGGLFSLARGLAVNVARFDPMTSTWSPLGSGTDGPVSGLAPTGTGLYLAGSFQKAGGKAASHFARWRSAPLVDDIVGEGPGAPNTNRVRVMTGSGFPSSVDVQAYGALRYGTNVASAEVDSDGLDEILTGPGPGAVFGPHVRGFSRRGVAMGRLSFYAFGTLRYGVRVAGGDADGDSFDEILTGPGPGDVFGPHLRGFDFDDSTLSAIPGLSFYAYKTPRFGVLPGSGDIDADGLGEILTGPGPGVLFGPHIRAFQYDGRSVRPVGRVSFDAYSLTGYGVEVAVGDVDGDGFAEILAAPGPGPSHEARFRGFNFDGIVVTALNGFQIRVYTTHYGGRVAGGDVRQTFRDALLAARGPDPAAAAEVTTFAYDGSALHAVDAGFIAFTGTYGVDVAAGTLGY